MGYYKEEKEKLMKKGYKMRKFVLLFFLLPVLAGCSESEKGESYMQISMDEAVDMMETEKDYIILDVRTEEEYKEGHIPNAICVPNETIGESAIDELPDKEQIILVYCRSGNRSKLAAAKLAAQGYTNIYEFGGILDWQGTVVSENK